MRVVHKAYPQAPLSRPPHSAKPMASSAAADAPRPEAGGPSTLYTALRILGFVVLALMLLSILYSGWITLENWGSIQV